MHIHKPQACHFQEKYLKQQKNQRSKTKAIRQATPSSPDRPPPRQAQKNVKKDEYATGQPVVLPCNAHVALQKIALAPVSRG
jgi:hypothetical protein